MKNVNDIEIGEDFLIGWLVVFTRPSRDVYNLSMLIGHPPREFSVQRTLTPSEVNDYNNAGLKAIVQIANFTFDAHESLWRLDKPLDELEVAWRGKEGHEKP